MKAGEEERRDLLRMVESALKNEAIAAKKSPEELSDEEVFGILQRLIKQRRESALQYRQGGRVDLAQKEEREEKFLEQYLPAPLSDEELESIVEEYLEKEDSQSFHQGRIVGKILQRFPGRVDGGRVAKAVAKLSRRK